MSSTSGWWYFGVTFGLSVVRSLYARWQRGRQLLVINDRPDRSPRIVNTAGWLVFLALGAVYVGVPGFRQAKWLGPLGMLVIVVGIPLAALALLLMSPPPPGSCSFREKGVVFYDGQRQQYVPWSEFDRYEWNHDTLLLYRTGVSLSLEPRIHGFEIPIERRPEVEAIVATRLGRSQR